MALILDPGTVYSTLDAALEAASCLSSISESGHGATILCATSGPDVSLASDEAYRVSVDAQQRGGGRWDVGIDRVHYSPCYRVQRLSEDQP